MDLSVCTGDGRQRRVGVRDADARADMGLSFGGADKPTGVDERDHCDAQRSEGVEEGAACVGWREHVERIVCGYCDDGTGEWRKHVWWELYSSGELRILDAEGGTYFKRSSCLKLVRSIGQEVRTITFCVD